MWLIRPRSQHRAGGGGPRRTGSTARRCCGRLWPTSVVSRGSARWVAPSPEEEDRRRLCRERRTLIEERISHVNRIQGLLFAQGISDYAPLRCDRRVRLGALRTGDGRELPSHLKAQISRELDRLELLLEQIKVVEAAQDALLAGTGKDTGEKAAPAPVTMLLALKGVGPNFAAVLWSEAFYRSLCNRRQVAAYAGLAATPWQSGGIRHEQGVEGRQSEAADLDDPVRLAVDTSPAAVGHLVHTCGQAPSDLWPSCRGSRRRSRIR